MIRATAYASIALSLSALTPRASTQTTYEAVPPLERSYVGPSVAPYASKLEVYNLFLPDEPAPPEGYPVLVRLNIGGWVSSVLPDSFGPTDELMYLALEDGWAVISATCVVSRGGASGNPVGPVGGHPDNDPLGPAYKGNGVFISPDIALPGYTGGPLHPYYDPERPMPEKDVIMLVQHVKANAGTAALPVDRNRMVLYATSAGAVACWWVAAALERKDLWANPVGQELESTIVDIAVLRGGLVYWPALIQTGIGYHFPEWIPGLYDLPGEDLADTLPALQESASAIVVAVDEQLGPGVTLANHQLQRHVAYSGFSFEQEDFDGPPYVLDNELDNHSSWHGAVWKTKFCHSRFIVQFPGSIGMEEIADWVAPSKAELIEDCRVWMNEAVSVGHPTAWTAPAGTNLAGTAGAPVLRACGSLAALSEGNLLVSNAPASATGVLMFGFSQLNLPFLGGVLVPAPDAVPVLTTSAQGKREIPFTWVAGVPPGFSFCLQAWLPDAGAPQGVAASNGLVGVTP